VNSFIEIIKNITYKIAYIIMRLYWRIFKPKTIGAKLIVVTETKILLLQPRTFNYWNLPGGGVKSGENQKQAALREFYEETGIKLESIDYLLGTYVSSNEGKSDTVFVFVKKIEHELLISNSFETANSAWFRFDDLPDGITKATNKRIQEYLKNEKKSQ
jgi:8-oxo-dGTP pyrophosphatase MutT (NUDIX family)